LEAKVKTIMRWTLGGLVLTLLLFMPCAAPSMAQARQPLALVRVLYNTQKAAAKPEGLLKEKIDALDKQIAEAMLLGRTGEARGLLAKGLVWLSGREWTDELEYSASLALRAEEVCVDSSAPLTIRLEQIYAPRVKLGSPLTARVSIHKSERGLLANRAGEKIRDLAAMDGMARDLMDEPARFEIDLSGIADGPCVIRVEVLEKERPVGGTSLRLDLVRGLHKRLAALAQGIAAVSGFEGLRDEVLYPADAMRNINRGKIALGSFDAPKELAKAEAALTSLKSGKDPFADRTGDMERHYLLDSAGEILPYRVYVPQAYQGDKSLPLVVALHGLGATQDSMFDGYARQVPKMAEQHGFLVVAPLGYRVDGGYGAALFRAANDPAVTRKSELSEADVMRVLELMKKNYRVDESRIYLMGHSMGAIGTWYLGAKYPGIWAALAPFAGAGAPATLEKMKDIPQIVVHGDADMTVPVAGSRAMVEMMKKLGVEHEYIEVPGGDHNGVVAPNIPAVFDFFVKQSKAIR
jgi:poly(3-hydroxybutyrate) depolymerase